MLRIPLTTCTSSGEFFDRTLDTAEFYGFEPIDRTLKPFKPTRTLKVRTEPTLTKAYERKLVALTKTLVAHGLHRSDATVLSYQVDHAPSKVATLHLHIVGSSSAMAEGLLLATLATAAASSGMGKPTVHINSMGDKESSARFVKELTAYLRTHLNDLPGYARDEMNNGNPIRAFIRLAEKKHECVADAPNSMEFLNDESRTHLHDILEYIEHLGLSYELDPFLVGSQDCWQHTIFDLRTTDENGNEVIFARGGRHDALAHKTFRVTLPVVSAIIEHEVQGRTKPKRRTQTHPQLFFAQLGPQAKKKSFAVLRMLHEAQVPISQQLTIESISAQLAHIDTAVTPFAIIMGHKEALEGTVIVRDMSDRSQVVVPLANLASYLKRLKI